jgi:hypothetical protein
MQVLLAAVGLGEIPASQHQDQSQRHTSHESPTTQAIPGSLDRHNARPFAINDNPTGPLVPHDTTRSHPGIASRYSLRPSQDTTFRFATNSTASVEPVNIIGSNTGQIYSIVEFGQVVSFDSRSDRTALL